MNDRRRFDPLDALRGFAMGSADIVPGVSGGTIALILGFYERLVHNIHQGARVLGAVVRLDMRRAKEVFASIEWGFLLTLLAGIGVAVLSLARLISYLLDNHPVGTSAVFFGLVAGSVVIAWGYIRAPAPVHVAIAAAVAVVAFLLLGLRSAPTTNPTVWFVFLAGAVAICAMILPGVSGSFILLMLGLYDYIIDAVKDFDLGVLAVFGVGAILGLALFSSFLDSMLRRYHDAVIAGLVGLMLGSLRVLWPWPNGTDDATLGAPDSGWPLALVLAAVAATVVLIFGVLGRRREAVTPHGAT